MAKITHHYRLSLHNILDGSQVMYDLDGAVTQCSRSINDTGGQLQWTGSLLAPVDYRVLLAPQKQVVWFWRDEYPIWGGIAWTLNVDSDQNTVQITAQGFSSYFNRIELLSDQTFTSQDELDVFRALMDYAQGRTNPLLNYAAINGAGTVFDTGGTDIGIQYDQFDAGQLISRGVADGLAGAQNPTIGSLMSDLAGVSTGFQWAETMQWSPGSNVAPTPYIRLAAPQFANTLPIRVEYPATGSNYGIQAYTVAIDGTTAVNKYVALGATNSTSNIVLRAIRNNTALQSQGYPILMGDSGSDYTSINTASLLDQHAQEDLATLCQNQATYQLTCRGSLIGQFDAGDALNCHFEGGWFKQPTDLTLRVSQWTFNPASTTQDETLVLDMIPLRAL